MSGQNIGLVALGTFFFVCGLLIVLERRRVSNWNNRESLKQTNGRNGGSPGRRMTPGMMSTLGAMVLVMGAAIFVVGMTVNTHGNGGGAPGMALSRLLGLAFAAPFLAVVLYLRRRDRRSSGTR